MTKHERILDISLLLGAAAAILAALFTGFVKNCDSAPDNTFRLHILANSDSAEDQAVKYELRNFLLSDLDSVFGNAADKQSAVTAAEQDLPFIEQRANEFLAKKGCT